LKRKMLAAREDLVNRVLKIASRKNVKLYGMINDTLELVIRADDMGLSLEEVVDQYGIVKAAKDAGFVPVAESLLYDIVEKVFQRNRRWVTKRWYEAGQWYGKYYSVRLPQDPVKAFKEDICSFTWNASEFSIVESEDRGEVVVRCVSPRFPLSYTTLFSVFLEGALNMFGYECVKRGVSKGIIRLRFRKVGGE
jgi:hypothetical protein